MALDDTIALLARAPVVGHLERDALRLLAFSAETRRLRTNEILFREGERSDGGYVVLQGELAAARSGSDAVALAGPGSLIGQTALFLPVDRPSSAVARRPSSVMRITPTLMRRVLQEFPAAAAAIQDSLAQDLDQLSGGLERVRQRLLSIGQRSASKDGKRPGR